MSWRGICIGIIQVISGNAFRQAAIFLSMLVVARLYGKEALGSLTLFIAIVNICQHVVFLKGEYRLITDQRRSDYISVFLYSLICMLVSCVVLGVLLAFLWKEPLYVFFYISCFIFVFLPALIEKAMARRGDYPQVTRIKAGDGLFQSLIPVFLGFISPHSAFLIAGRSYGFGLSLLLFKKLREETIKLCGLAYRRFQKKGIELAEFKGSVLRNRYLIVSGFITSLSVNLPVIAVAAFFSDEMLGVYGMVSRILGVPITLVAASLSTVFIAECNKVRRSGRAGVLKLLYAFSGFSFVLGVCVYIACHYMGGMFDVMLGEDWQGTGEIASVMAVHFAMQMFVNPISTIAITLDETKVQSVFDAARLMILAAVLFWGRGLGVESMLYFFSICSGIIYLAYYVFFWTRCKKYERTYEAGS